VARRDFPPRHVISPLLARREGSPLVVVPFPLF
jgi:hypothetical protein